jgi:dynein heavy chain
MSLNFGSEVKVLSFSAKNQDTTEKYIKSENYIKLDYSQMNPVIEERNALMKGKYSSLRKGIAYINPKVNEPHELLPGRPPRKVMIDRMKKVYATINIEALLKKVGIDYMQKDLYEEWLPLEFFEDKDMDIFTPDEWIARAVDKSKGEVLFIPGVGLQRDSYSGTGIWRRVIINHFNQKTEKFEGFWDRTEEVCELPKIDLLFDAENPYVFCKKVSLAHQEREKAESIIRYNLYINRMETRNLSALGEDQKTRLKKGIEKISYLKLETKLIDDLLTELNTNYQRTTNKIIFDKFYFSPQGSDLIINNLKLPSNIINNPDVRTKESRYFGLEAVPVYDYITDYKNFTFKTLLCRKEIIDCLQKIKDECNKIKNSVAVFLTDIKKPLRLQDFKRRQKNQLTVVEKKLEVEWVMTIKDVLEKSLNGVGKGSFNLNVASKEIYEYLKLKKYMTVVKLLMQDTIYSLVNKSMKGYVDFFEKFIPEEVIIEDVNKVKNVFPIQNEEEKLNTTYELINMTDDTQKENSSGTNEEDDDIYNENEQIWPLFQVNITKKDGNKVLDYTTKPEELVPEIMMTFDAGLKKLQKIPQVEPLLLNNLIKKAEKQIIPLKSVARPHIKPSPTTQEQISSGYELNEDAIAIWELYERLEASLLRGCEPLKRYLQTFTKYNDDIALDPNEYTRKIKEDKNFDVWTNSKIRDDIIINKNREKEVLNEIPQIIHVSFFQINCKEFRSEIASKYAKIAELEIDILKEKASAIRTDIQNGYVMLKSKIQKEIKTIADLVSVQGDMEQIETELQKLKEKTVEVDEINSILDSFNVQIDSIEFEYKLQLIGGPTDIENTRTSTNIILDKKKDQLYEEQIENQNKLIEEVMDLKGNIMNFETYINEEKSEEAFKLADHVQKQLTEYINKAQMYNERETLFGKPKTNYSNIYDLKNLFSPFYWLWTSIRSWKQNTKSWYDDNFSKLKGDDVEIVVNEVAKDLKNSIAKFKDRIIDPRIIELAQKYKTEVDTFKPKADLAMAITKKGLKQRHWEELKVKTSIECTPNPDLTFRKIIDKGMLNYLEICQDIGEKALREFSNEEEILGIDRNWKEKFFHCIDHKATKVKIIANWNDINKALDEDILKIATLEVSPFKGPFTDQIKTWSDDLILISNIIEEWNKCQKSWIYLQPVFDSGDIAKDIPTEYKKFTMTDRMFRELMQSIDKGPPLPIKQHCQKEGLHDKLKEANMNLESVTKGLNDYMEKKRAIFPRFFFISDSQFLEILSQTKDIKMVKDNLSKIFESINNIELKDDRFITVFKSRLDESLQLEEKVSIYGKNVEIWMKELEKMMFRTVRAYFERAIKDYTTKPRKEWVKVHPGQLVMHGNQVAWTREIEEAIQTGTLKNYLAEYKTRILDLVHIVKEKQTRLMSINLSNLITIDVHNENVTLELIKNNVQSTSSFEWIMQLRYYWETYFNLETCGSFDNCLVKSVQTDFPYGYEYMGNNEILVITPLTDKCYLTLMGALRLNLGGAPAGPAGTGKTESTKDLARSLAKLCIVYNCSEDTDYTIVGKFFKGLAFCGAWICFDEFNRINIEVLSVIAQQLSQLFSAKDNKESEIIFETTRIEILPTFCVFITMNPGYAGRTELPDNLKALFRPIAMMVPDYRLIAEINLYSAGYTLASELATKVVSTMKLSSEQLSTQGHYDFGMRAVKSVLNAARRLKRTEVDTSESQLLLRALEDVNVPKFLSEDMELFRNIISDLFPGIERPKIDYSALLSKIDEVSNNHGLLPANSFKQKIIQLYDTLQVRHGLMLVGPAGGGKTSNYTILREAISALADDKNYLKTQSFVINPKSIRHAEIYSEQDTGTGEWYFGVLPLIINECKRDTSGKKKYWIIFDGPVDAMWIEDMNSVLDDSKKLCLASSDIILLNEYITIMFEVEDLIVASPATVSRCGMVYMEPSAVGLIPLVTCWADKLNNYFKPEEFNFNQILKSLFDLYLEESIYFVRKKLKEPCPTVDNNLAKSVMRIVDTFLDKYTTQEAMYNQKKLTEEIKGLENNLEGVFFYSLVWALGTTTNEEGRKKFSQFLREQINIKSPSSKYKFPEEGSVYDYSFDSVQGIWVKWMDTISTNFEISFNASYTEVIVPTPDSIRYCFLITRLVKNNKHVITTGPTGTGKTINIMDVLSRSLGDKYTSIIINFSAQTTARQTQTSLEIKLKKYGRGKYGPDNNKIGAVFIDDMNMPVRQDSGAQPPIELLRQYLDHKGWYELKDKTFITVDNLFLLGAMGTPGGGKNLLSQRFQRHFNLITYNELEDTSIQVIFYKIVKHFLRSASDEIKQQIENTVNSTLNIYKEIKNFMLPTPAKMHYIFNLRDMSKVLQGVSSISLKHSTKAVQVVRLWVHEMTRVFGDRLINETDRTWLNKKIEKDVVEVFGQSLEQVYEYGKTILFCDFIANESNSSEYIQVTNLKKFKEKIESYLEAYNENSKKKKLNLVMFLDACDHVARICRILRQPQGNALLLGVGGSGRQSLARLASFINDFECHQIEVIKNYQMRDFAKNVKESLIYAGLSSPVTFLIVDTQIIYPLMLEYINNILNSGDVPNLYQKEDMEEIKGKLRAEAISKYGNFQDSTVMKVYLARVMKNIHLVLAMSPMSSDFVQRLRMFPSLVNCCTLDWFSEWPEEALESVADDIFTKNPMDIDEFKEGIVKAFKFIHKSVELESKEFSMKMRRHVYLTPTSYLELLNMYQKLLKSKRTDYNEAIKRLENGLNVLMQAGEEVEKLEISIKEQKPELEKKSKNATELKNRLEIENKIALDEEKDAIIKEKEAEEFNEECTKLLSEAKIELNKVWPLIDKAKKSIEKVQEKDLRDMASYRAPPAVVVNLLEALLIFKKGHSYRIKEYIIPNSPPDKNPYRIKDALDDKIGFQNVTAVKADLESFCKDEETLEPLKTTYLNNMRLLDQHFVERDLTYEKAFQGARSIIGLWEYLYSLNQFVKDSIEKIDPLKIKVHKAEIDKNRANAEKDEAVKKKKEAQEKVARLNEEYEKVTKEQKELTESLILNEEKLVRASQLIKLLEGERVRWMEDVKNFKYQLNNLIGDCLISAGAICYNGPFTQDFRQKLETTWRDELKKLKVIHSPGVTMIISLKEEIKVKEWTVCSLPEDNLSIENGIIIECTRRWPLMIDPQNQGSTFIKKYGKKKEILEVVKASDTNFLSTIVGAIKNTKWILLENVGVNLDPALEPILTRNGVESGYIKIGENMIPWSDKFKLFISTTIPNPHFSPETFVKVTVINFGITLEGLEEQMMTLLINNEMPELEQRKNAIMNENFQSMNERKKTEDDILKDLSKSEGGGIEEFLNTDELIKSLKDAKTKSEEISQKIEEGKITSEQIRLKRENYRPAAFRSSLLFFATLDLSSIDPMYQFSLQWFSKLYENSIKITPNSSVQETRIANLNKFFTKILYENVCRSLFNKDKLLFSFVICHKILTGELKDKIIKPEQWRYFLAGPSGDVDIAKNPTEWISKNEWPGFYRQLRYLSENFDETKGLEAYFIKNSEKFKLLYDSASPQSDDLPDLWNQKVSDFLKLCILKMIRPDKLIAGLQIWIEKNIGRDFVDPPPFSLHKSFKESSNIVPIIFILSPGSDPINDIKNYSEEQGFSKRFETISLGRGQEKKAKQKLEDMRTKGGWVLLQNCHLAKSFMGELEEIVENFDTNWPDKDFRLWLTSMSNDYFPVSILQNSIKITVEPPKGLKNNLLKTYDKLENKDLDDCVKKEEFKALIFGLSFFHAIVQDRRKYGPIGWNVKYDFTNEDWIVCKKQIKIFLEQYDGIPFQVLSYLIGEINYGGRVTDDKDQRLIKNILKTYLNEEIFKYSNYKFSKSGKYFCPESGEQENYVAYINLLPGNSEPEVFGLNENADIVTAQNECYSLLETVLSIQPRVSGKGGKSQESMLMELLGDIDKKQPEAFDIDEVKKKFPTAYLESMNTVLVQEILRYNVLLKTMKKSIKSLQKALKGEIVMSEDLEKMSKSLYLNQVPQMWSGVFLSLKPLSSWITDLIERITFLDNWYKSGQTPNTFWISGKNVIKIFRLFFPSSFPHSSSTKLRPRPTRGHRPSLIRIHYR